MGIIDIDDRDVYNYYQVQADPLTFQKYLNSLKSENKTANIVNLGEGRYKLDLPAIVCTGADVTTLFQIPFMHMLDKIELKHTDINGIDSTDSLQFSLSHRIYPNLWIMMSHISNLVDSDLIFVYNDYRYERGQYLINITSTNTTKVYLAIYIKFTGD